MSDILTHCEIAARLGISKSRVEQIERQALRKLLRGLQRAGMGRREDWDVAAEGDAEHGFGEGRRRTTTHET